MLVVPTLMQLVQTPRPLGAALMHFRRHQASAWPHLSHSSGICVAGLLRGCDIGKGGLVGRAGEQAEEVLEVVVAGGAANQEKAGPLDLQLAER